MNMNVVPMHNTRLLIQKNHFGTKWRIPLVKGVACYTYESDILDFNGIRKILNFVSAVHNKFPGVNVPLSIDMGAVTAADKLSITILECIVYSLIADYRHRVAMYFRVEHTIFTECIRFSPLRLLGNPTQKNLQSYQFFFLSDMRMEHFRRVISQNAAENGDLSIVMTDVQMFLQHQFIDSEYSAQLAEVIAELIGNATEHSRTSCLLDVDFSSAYHKKIPDESLPQNKDQDEYLGVSVSVISFSTVSFEDGMRHKLTDAQCSNVRYARVSEAYKQHQNFFSDAYSLNDFLRIVAFQDRISGRIGETTSGGTGLTTLLKSLEENSDSDRCYLLAGDRILFFDKTLLDHDEDGWIGFNSTNDFFYSPPSSHILRTCPVFLPGVAYNLNFVCKKEINHEDSKPNLQTVTFGVGG